jgi:hypothetical protein
MNMSRTTHLLTISAGVALLVIALAMVLGWVTGPQTARSTADQPTPVFQADGVSVYAFEYGQTECLVATGPGAADLVCRVLPSPTAPDLGPSKDL